MSQVTFVDGFFKFEANQVFSIYQAGERSLITVWCGPSVCHLR